LKKINQNQLLLQHLRGVSFRNLAEEHNISPATAYRKTKQALDKLPHCADITRKYCTKFHGIILVDGKYVKVKRYDRKIPVLYGIDYKTHDIPTYLLSRGENYRTCMTYFQSLRLLNYPLQGMVCDDNINIIQACKQVYPQAVVQICHNHYKENIRRTLQVRTDETYRSFMRSIESILGVKRSILDIHKRARGIFKAYQNDQLCSSVLIDIQRRQEHLFGYQSLKGLPITTNLIECYNSHLQGRLKTIKGFESFTHAKNWLNGYFIQRRTKKLTDCSGKFRNLNGKTSLELTQTKNPKIF